MVIADPTAYKLHTLQFIEENNIMFHQAYEPRKEEKCHKNRKLNL